jgi:hypothetical protein
MEGALDFGCLILGVRHRSWTFVRPQWTFNRGKETENMLCLNHLYIVET